MADGLADELGGDKENILVGGHSASEQGRLPAIWGKAMAMSRYEAGNVATVSCQKNLGKWGKRTSYPNDREVIGSITGVLASLGNMVL